DAALAVVVHDPARIYAVLLQRAQHELVAADAPHEPSARAQPCSRDGLVGALAPGNAFVGGIGDRLARPRKPRAARHVVDVRGADHRDPGRWAHAGMLCAASGPTARRPRSCGAAHASGVPVVGLTSLRWPLVTDGRLAQSVRALL